MGAGTLQENAQVEMEEDVVFATTATNLATSRRLAPTEVEVVVEIIETVITGITEEAAIEMDITVIREIRIITQEETPTELPIDLPVGQIAKETFPQYRRGPSVLLCLANRTPWDWTPLSLLNHQLAANSFRSPDGWMK